ncbi:MAG: hypothetical protein QM676_13925, partial [Novosphingobium sp.]
MIVIRTFGRVPDPGSSTNRTVICRGSLSTSGNSESRAGACALVGAKRAHLVEILLGDLVEVESELARD